MRGLTLLLIAAGLAGGCQPEGSAIARRQAELDPPGLWRVEAVDAAGVRRGAGFRICADTQLRQGFIRPAPDRDGESCRMVGRPVVRTNGQDLRCMLGGEPFGLHISVVGDRERDFHVRLSAQSLAGGGAFEQRLRYRKLGACPPGWRIGYAARDGDAATTDALLRGGR